MVGTEDKMPATEMPDSHITMVELGGASQLSLLVRRAFDMAMEEQSRLQAPLFDVRGLTNPPIWADS